MAKSDPVIFAERHVDSHSCRLTSRTSCFGHLGVELYNDALWSPNCARAPRYFGRLCANHAHSAIEETWDELGDSFRGGTQDFLAEGIWPKWQDYARAAIATLGLESSVVPGHEGCWHRRGKAALPIVFRVALLLRTAGEIGPTEMHDGMYTYPGPEEYLGRAAGILPSLKDNGELDGTTPRGLVVRREEEPWIAIRSDGWVLTRHGSVHIREMWQKGVDEVTIAKEIQSLAKWGEADLPAAQKDEVQARST